MFRWFSSLTDIEMWGCNTGEWIQNTLQLNSRLQWLWYSISSDRLIRWEHDFIELKEIWKLNISLRAETKFWWYS